MAREGATQETAFLIDVSSMGFAESDDRSRWLQIMPYGSWQHPVYGKIDLTKERAVRFAQNFVARVRGQDLDVDYDHKAKTDKAAGWFKNVEARDDGLYAQVAWTQPAFAALKAGEYRYFSPEFAERWKNPRTGETHQDVLFGGALTNRPFLKDILPINLNESVGDLMDPKVIRELLGLPEDATDEQVKTKLAETIAAGSVQEPDPNAPPANQSADQTPPTPQPAQTTTTQPEPVKASEDAELIKLAESSPALKRMLDEREADRKRIAALELSDRTKAVELQLSELFSETEDGRKRVLSPNVRKQLTEALAEAPVALSDTITAQLKDILKDGIVELGEIGTTGGSSGSTREPVTGVKKFNDAVDKLMQADDKLAYQDAVERVAEENPQLYADYRVETIQLAEEIR